MIVPIKCANSACNREILFVQGMLPLPTKTYCDFCCQDMSTPPDNTPLDTRIRPVARLDRK